MRYYYAPYSYPAHESATWRERELRAPAPTHRVLQAAAAIDVDAPSVPDDARKLVRQLEGLGVAWLGVRRAVAEDLVTMQLVDSVTVRFRGLRGVLAGWALWLDGRTAGVRLVRPAPAKVTIQSFRVMLGLEAPPAPVVQLYDNCYPPRIGACGAQHVRVKLDGFLYAHKTPWGHKCEQ